MKDDECMFHDCLKGGLRLSCLVIATFLFAKLIRHEKSSIYKHVFKTAPVQLL